MKATLIFGSSLLAGDYIIKHEGNFKYISSYTKILGYENCEIVMLYMSEYHSERKFIDEYCETHNITIKER